MVKLDWMLTANKQPKNRPPKLIDSFAAGFNLVSGNLHLILYPALLDVLLWLGPALKMKRVMMPYIENSAKLIESINNPDFLPLADLSRQLWTSLFEQFNLLVLFRTFPIGIPSLMAATPLNETPLGNIYNIELSSVLLSLLVMMVIMVAGVFAGSQFFNHVASLSGEKKGKHASPLHAFLQSLLISFMLWMVMLILTFPMTLFLTIIGNFNPGLVQVALILGGLILIWLLMPLVFSAHGIFTDSLNAVRSTLTSIRLIRFFLPGAGAFFLSGIILSQGMDIIWKMPATGSWVFLMGILGHAFITSSLVAASFIYYRGGLKFMQESLNGMSRLKTDHEPGIH